MKIKAIIQVAEDRDLAEQFLPQTEVLRVGTTPKAIEVIPTKPAFTTDGLDGTGVIDAQFEPVPLKKQVKPPKAMNELTGETE